MFDYIDQNDMKFGYVDFVHNLPSFFLDFFLDKNKFD